VYSVGVTAAIAIYVIPICQWIVIFCNWGTFGIWSTCIGFTCLALVIHASVLIVPVIIGLVVGMPADGFPDREVITMEK